MTNIKQKTVETELTTEELKNKITDLTEQLKKAYEGRNHWFGKFKQMQGLRLKAIKESKQKIKVIQSLKSSLSKAKKHVEATPLSGDKNYVKKHFFNTFLFRKLLFPFMVVLQVLTLIVLFFYGI